MNVDRLFAACLALFLLAGPAHPQGYAGLSAEAEGYAQVVPGHALSFPDDHLPHPDFRIEWWYITAALEGPEGAAMGLQWTLFRQATRPRGGADATEGWESRQFWMGHAAVTTETSHHVAERFARGGIGQAGASGWPFTAWIDDWALESTAPLSADAYDALTVSAAGEGFAYSVALTAEGPLVRHGDAGFSVKSEAGQASYYYSQPFYRVSGEVTLDGKTVPVTGQAWLDREWSSQPLAEGQEGWDWLSLHLADGAKVMAYRLREGEAGAYTVGTWIDADGVATALRPGEVQMEERGRARVAGRDVPVRWRLAVPGRGLDVETAPVNAQSWMTTVFSYWEGPVRVTGSHGGVGYLEMTGY